jgi:hypothetical protein
MSAVSRSNTNYLSYGLPIILVSLLAVLAVYFSRIRKSGFETMLNAAYYQKYESIRDVVMNSQLSGNSKKEIKEDIFDLLISAQKADKNIDDVVKNPAEFAENIIKAYMRPPRRFILTFLNAIVFILISILLTHFVLWLENVRENFFTTSIDINVIVVIFFLAFVAIPASNAFKPKQSIGSYAIPLLIIVVFILLLGIFVKSFTANEFVEQLYNGSINMIPNIIVFTGYLAAIPMCILLKAHFRRSGR